MIWSMILVLLYLLSMMDVMNGWSPFLLSSGYRAARFSCRDSPILEPELRVHKTILYSTKSPPFGPRFADSEYVEEAEEEPEADITTSDTVGWNPAVAEQADGYEGEETAEDEVGDEVEVEDEDEEDSEHSFIKDVNDESELNDKNDEVVEFAEDDSPPTKQKRKTRASSTSRLITREKPITKPLKSETSDTSSATVEYHPPIERFSRHFLAFAFTPLQHLSRRDHHWDHFLQWIRRSALLANAPFANENATSGSRIISADVEIKDAFTILSADRLTPVGQYVYITANSSCVVSDYLGMEPLQRSGVLQWRWLEMCPSTKTLADVYSPFLLLAMSKNSDALQKAASIHTKYNFDDVKDYAPLVAAEPSLFYRNITRSVFHALAYAAHDPADYSHPIGEVCLFNADSNREALRYVQSDPLLQREAAAASPLPDDNELLIFREKPDSSEGGLVALSPVNLLDVDGLNRWTPETFAEAAQLDKLHKDNPEDMLMDRGQGHPHLADHFEENARVVKYLSRRGVSFRYERPADLSPKRGTPLGELREKWRKELRFGLRITDPTQSVEERHDLDFETKMPLLFPLSPASNETTATAN